MPLGQCTHKPVAATYFSLVAATDMTACMTSLLGINYEGAIMAHKVDGVVEWWMSINGPAQQNLVARTGDVLIWDGTTLVVVTTAFFTANYTVG